MNPNKILIIRLSSIGDIILTTPVVRSLKKGLPDSEIHFLVKEEYKDLLIDNPWIDKIHTWNNQPSKTISELKKEHFDLVIDLHKNLRTFRIKTFLGVNALTFDKQNIPKFLLTKFGINRLSTKHIVERYAEVLNPLNVTLDQEGLDFIVKKEDSIRAEKLLSEGFTNQDKFIAIVLGAQHFTKRWLQEYHYLFIEKTGIPVVLLGGKDTCETAHYLAMNLTIPFIDLTGKCSIGVSAGIMKKSIFVLTHDTGLMHIAAALKMPQAVLWGNTIPEFGMYPYRSEYINLEIQGLNCRPCSKIGYNACPQKHFNCMKLLTPEFVFKELKDKQYL
jgi:heptosyltransferase-2